MALNQLLYHAKNILIGVFNIVGATPANINLDSSGTLNKLTITSGGDFTSTEKMAVRRIQVRHNGVNNTATNIRFFLSTSSSAPSSSNTWFWREVVLPASGASISTSASTPFALEEFDPGTLWIPANHYLYVAPAATLTNGADVLVTCDTFAE